MISTSTRLFLQTPPPPVNIFSSGDNSALSPSSLTFRQSGYFTAAAATCASVETESPTSRYSTLPRNLIPASPASFYEILDIPMGATVQEIKAAYRRLARVCHPDVAAIDQKDSSADDFMKIHSAYSTLSDPDKRADYDRRLSRRHRSINLYSGGCSPSAMSGFTGYTPRNWETDQCW
ncbi:PREDICTED: chaperone protein dnaJ 11, chloroplastic-like [Nicotiana attenuata]|uniref:Chaperone protein dnaj 11, chloroplastic n=1 Tax=Nicotiana attenuata TaxID=49451 RepID=A0A1J6KZN5_NICAT|nr:PREDICTED: chaperone protein dnaJ 11, chloroplastic-like [Nicotiana attenuata]OIT24497.1 chaperone protein dnaj 11, chloroplastic [Nicotiana attenuata]